MCDSKYNPEFNEIAILGGDLRNVELANLYAKDGVKVYVYGLGNSDKLLKSENIIEVHNIDRFFYFSNFIISGIPFSKDGLNINAPFCNENVSVRDLLEYINNKVFIAGKIEEGFLEILKKQNNKVIDLMKDEPLTIYNAISTVEGAIASVINKTDITIYKSNILILGYGRIGKILADRLKSFGANIYCEARKTHDLAWINTFGYNNVELNSLDSFFEDSNRKVAKKIDVIINTIPHLILNRELLEKIKSLNSDIFILDLASDPGGVDFEFAKLQRLNVEWLLGVPGKVAPVTSAKFIKDRIYDINKFNY